jgi:ribosomal protein L21E
MTNTKGYRRGTRYLFSRAFRQRGVIPLSTYMRVYKRGDIVDIKVSVRRLQAHISFKSAHGLCRKRVTVPFKKVCHTSFTTVKQGACSMCHHMPSVSLSTNKSGKRLDLKPKSRYFFLISLVFWIAETV